MAERLESKWFFPPLLPHDDKYGLTSVTLLSSFSNHEHWGEINHAAPDSY